jgi:hypothetical protein
MTGAALPSLFQNFSECGCPHPCACFFQGDRAGILISVRLSELLIKKSDQDSWAVNVSPLWQVRRRLVAAWTQKS